MVSLHSCMFRRTAKPFPDQKRIFYFPYPKIVLEDDAILRGRPYAKVSVRFRICLRATPLWKGGDPYGMKLPWSLRDSPVALAIAVIGVLVIMLTLGWLTVRIGSLLARNYLHRQAVLSE